MNKRFYSTKEAKKFYDANDRSWYEHYKPFLPGIRAPGYKSKIVYDIVDLNAFADKIKSAKGVSPKQEIERWGNTSRPASLKGATIGTLINGSEKSGFESLAEQLILKRR